MESGNPALPNDIGNEHVRIKDILYLKFMFYHIAIPSLHYIFWNAYEGYKTPRSKKLQRRRIYGFVLRVNGPPPPHGMVPK